MHSTHNIDDNYLGSGKLIRRSIKKYGRSNHTIEILEYHNTRDELSIAEAKIVNASLLQNPLCMNLKCVGEDRGFIGGRHTPSSKEIISLKNRERFTNEENRLKLSKKLKGRKYSNETIDKMKQAKQNMSQETKLKMSKFRKGKPSNNAKPITLDGIEYQSMSEAAKLLNVSRHKIREMISN